MAKFFKIIVLTGLIGGMSTAASAANINTASPYTTATVTASSQMTVKKSTTRRVVRRMPVPTLSAGPAKYSKKHVAQLKVATPTYGKIYKPAANKKSRMVNLYRP